MNSKKFDGMLYDCPYVESIKDIVDRSAAEYSERTAYMFKDSEGAGYRSISYEEFRLEQNSLGTALLELGLKQKNIAVIGENSYHWALSYLTVVCGVGVIVPIDRALESEEIINLLKRADIELLFMSAKSAGKLEGALRKVKSLKHLVVMDDAPDEAEADAEKLPRGKHVHTMSGLIARGSELLAKGDDSYTSATVKADELAAILFTSGTTGLAKGVMLSHRNIAANAYNMSKHFHAPDGARVLSVLPMHHAYEMTCTVITCFYQGACVVICRGLKYIKQDLTGADCNVMLGVPLIFEKIYRRIMNKAEQSGQRRKLNRAIATSRALGLKNNKTAMRRMFGPIHDMLGNNIYEFIVGGAPMDPEIIENLELMGLPMMQGYGMTENAPLISVNTDRYGKAASVGRPVPGTTVDIIGKDESGIGEIICKGPSVMMGYYKDPERTSEVLHDGWLFTGDYGRFDEDGFLYITGRKKSVIVNKGGKNIFPEEVEQYLLLEPYVSEVLVYGKPGRADKADVVITAIILPDFDALNRDGIKTDAQIYRALSEGVGRANAKMPSFKRVMRIEIREKGFIKTTTEKIKRFEKGNYDYKFDDSIADSGIGIQRD